MAHTLAAVDLNLLPLLDALLSEQHVTRAASRVGLSQPAASRGLSRLRALLDDPLLVRTGASFRLTDRAETLRATVRRAMGLVEEAIAPPRPFDAAQIKRTIRIASDDYAELVVLGPLVARLARAAPGINLQVRPSRDSGIDRLGRGEVDLFFAPSGERLPAGIYADAICADRFVCMVSRKHPFARRRRPPTLDQFLGARHALIAPFGGRGGFMDDALAARGKERRVALVLPHFLVMPFLIAQSDLVLTLAERVARTYAGILPITLFRPPLPLPGFTTACLWHERDRTDPTLSWLRNEIAALPLARRPRSSRA